MDKRIQLKIKIKNLADEAKTIRREERKLHGMQKWELQHHRKTVVRDAARRSLMAYQFIRDKDWRIHASEPKLHDDWKEFKRMVLKYGGTDALERLGVAEAA